MFKIILKETFKRMEMEQKLACEVIDATILVNKNSSIEALHQAFEKRDEKMKKFCFFKIKGSC